MSSLLGYFRQLSSHKGHRNSSPSFESLQSEILMHIISVRLERKLLIKALLWKMEVLKYWHVTRTLLRLCKHRTVLSRVTVCFNGNGLWLHSPWQPHVLWNTLYVASVTEQLTIVSIICDYLIEQLFKTKSLHMSIYLRGLTSHDCLDSTENELVSSWKQVNPHTALSLSCYWKDGTITVFAKV